MSRTTVQFNDYISLLVLFLMFAAYIGGQAEAGPNPEHRIAEEPVIEAMAIDDHFRGEDE